MRVCFLNDRASSQASHQPCTRCFWSHKHEHGMPLSTSSSEEFLIEHLRCKLVLLGAEAVGKSSIVRKLVQQQHQAKYTPTVGAEYYKAEVRITGDIHATLQVWDVGSHVSSINMAANFVQGCDAILLVYDATRPETFTQAREWLGLLQQLFQETALPYIAFIANKVEDDAVQTAAVNQLQLATADVQHAYGYSLSAKSGQNIRSTFLRIAADLAGIPLTQQQIDEALQEQTAVDHSSNSPRGQLFLQQLVQHRPTSSDNNNGAVSSGLPDAGTNANAGQCGGRNSSPGLFSRALGRMCPTAKEEAEEKADIGGRCSACIRLLCARRQQKVAVGSSATDGSNLQQGQDNSQQSIAGGCFWGPVLRCCSCLWGQRKVVAVDEPMLYCQ